MYIKKVIIWGLKSTCFEGFFKAFKHLNYDTYRIDDDNVGSEINFSDCMFFIEGSSSKNIPIRDDCFYILHNCNLNVKNYMKIQMYTNDVINRDDCCPVPDEKFMYYSLKKKSLYFYWGTDLLPSEIENIKTHVKNNFKKQEKKACFIGNISDNETFGNFKQLNNYVSKCKENNIPVVQDKEYGSDKGLYNVSIISRWEKESGYISNNIFQNISYGSFGITNSKNVFDLFNQKVCYDTDEFKLFYKSIEYVKNITVEEQLELMDEVKSKHTYLNRIKNIIWFIRKQTIVNDVAVILYHKDIYEIYDKEWIKDCLSSIFSQTYNKFDVLELNYGKENYSLIKSPAGEAQTSPRLREKSPNHKCYYWNKTMENHVHAMNFLLDKAFLEFDYNIVFNINIDDYYDVSRFSKQLPWFKEGYDIVSSNYYNFQSNGEKIVKSAINVESYAMDQDSIKKEFDKNNNIVAHPSVAYSKKFWKMMKYYDDVIPKEDIQLWKRSIREGIKFKILPDYLLYYRIHDNQIMATKDREIQIIKNSYDKICKICNAFTCNH